MRPSLVKKALAAIFLVVFAVLGAWAQQVLPVPALTARVIDTTGTLQPAEIAALDAKLGALEADKGSQVVVLMVPTTAPEDIAAFAQRVGDTWKIGRKNVGDGLLLLVAKDDRRVRIEVAKTLEGAIPDIAAKDIIDRAITPFFRQNQYAAGLDAGVEQIAARIRGEALPPLAAPQGRAGKAGVDRFDLAEGALLVFISLPIVNGVARKIFGRKLGALITSAGMGGLMYVFTASVVVSVIAGMVALWYAFLVSLGSGLPRARSGRGGFFPVPGGGWGGGFGGGGFDGGGGFSSGGGGDFGGGGASGSW
ncbi:YgcG family protein [Ottowia sp. GY511]|uniref:TPM domain-containing protein n=1 Tax=Ottowia flava TaxID=2675430 RepID=A0ABW4KYZ3_9BURK|nr:TPM domain-containing protein [Ottowia sp. GY511]TXK27344.1 YgcG family protein [Ottowia sp. GY511]